MKFYLTHIQTVNGTEAISTFSYDNRNTAIMTYHQTIASDMASESIDKSLIVLLSETGMPEMVNNYTKPFVPVIPEMPEEDGAEE